MKHNFHFDKKTGTMVPGDQVTETSTGNQEAEIKKPVFQKEKRIDVGSEPPLQRVVDMKRVGERTAMRLVNDDGMPESYIDSVTEGIMMFREMEDYDLCQITDDRSGKVLAYIGGYALQINFNMSELDTMEKIEQCLQGITKLFRHKIINQSLSGRRQPE